MTKEKPKLTIDDLNKIAVDLAQKDKVLTENINNLIKSRNLVRAERRNVELKITTYRINSQVF
jgi:hypothetical protein